MEFKTGDEVECIDNAYGRYPVTIGKIYRVEDTKGDDFIRVIGNDGSLGTYKSSRFKELDTAAWENPYGYTKDNIRVIRKIRQMDQKFIDKRKQI